MVEAESQALEGAAPSPDNQLEQDPKRVARELLSQGVDVDTTVAQSGLSRPVVLGISGALKKAQKKLDKAQGEPPLQPGKSNSDEESLVSDIKQESRLDAAALLLARTQNRLRQAAPELYDALHGKETQAESSPSRTLIDLEVLREIKAMRTADEGSHNGDSSSQATAELQRQINELKESLHQKDVEALKKETEKLAGEIGELRADLRHSTNSNSDLAVVVREGKDLVVKMLETPGPLRSYLIPDGINIQKPSDAPKLQTQIETRSGVIEELRGRGLVTKVVERRA